MLKITNLNKHYKSKKGQDHHALKDINLEFGDKGFVFILGKSGSGKSTLLNILGGLDNFDSGDIEIKSKSSKDFKAKDWDSYRNTYVGFVFQDFNIIENYSIKKNIGLALELQGVKKKNISSLVENILAQVDLEGYGKRKPNELSGGQMQRIAIARALVKNPEIILADEPTGNLDSQTSKQIMDRLKELSEDKLVIMVSHDAESADKYADRIVELKDGFVIRDVVRVDGNLVDNPTVLSVSTINPETAVFIPKGKTLTNDQIVHINHELSKNDGILYIPITKGNVLKEDLEKINELLNKNSDTVLPIISESETTDLKSNIICRIDSNEENLNRFNKTSTSPFKLIKSILPISNSIKMAISSIWRKKFKLLFSLILFLVAVGLFGFSETVTRFDFAKAAAKTYDTGNIDIITLSNTDKVLGWDKEETAPVPFNTKVVKTFMSDFNYDYALLYNFASNGVNINNSTEFIKVSSLTGFFEIKDITKFNLSILAGTLPITNDEIMLTDFVVDYYIEEKEYSDYQDIVGELFEIEGLNYKIVGVLDTDYEEYLFLNDIAKSQYEEYTSEIGKYQNKLSNIYARVFVKEGFYENYEKSFNGFSRYYSFQIPNEDSKNEWDTTWVTNEVYKYTDGLVESNFKDKYLFVNDTFDGLRQNEIIVSPEVLAGLHYLKDSTIIWNIINDVRSNDGNIYDELVKAGYLGDEFEISIVSESDWKRIDVVTLKVVGVVDFGFYKQVRDVQSMYEYVESKGVDYNALKEKYPHDSRYENIFTDPGQFSYFVTTDYIRLKLTDIGIESYTEENFWHGLIIEELKFKNIDFLTKEEFIEEMEILSEVIKAFERGENDTIVSETTTELYNKGFYPNINSDNWDEEVVQLYKNYLDQLSHENEIYPDGDYWGYMDRLGREHSIRPIMKDDQIWGPVILNQFTYDGLNPFQAEKAHNVVVKLQDDIEANERFFDTASLQGYKHVTMSGNILEIFEQFRDDAAHIFRYVSFGLAGFASVLMFTNISSSVFASKKQIGTLRAIGAKGSDVATIFVVEGLIIGIFTTVLAIIALQISTVQLNKSLTSQIGIDISIFNSSPIVAIEMLALAILIVIIASFLPVKGVSLMKPINAIKNK